MSVHFKTFFWGGGGGIPSHGFDFDSASRVASGFTAGARADLVVSALPEMETILSENEVACLQANKSIAFKQCGFDSRP